LESKVCFFPVLVQRSVLCAGVVMTGLVWLNVAATVPVLFKKFGSRSCTYTRFKQATGCALLVVPVQEFSERLSACTIVSPTARKMVEAILDPCYVRVHPARQGSWEVPFDFGPVGRAGCDGLYR